MSIPGSTLSIIVFLFTIGVGYVILVWAYSSANKLEEWYKIDTFDKTLQTFLVGGLITIMSFLILKAPLNLLIDSNITEVFWENWIRTNLSGIIISEVSIGIITWILITELFVKPFSAVISYAR